jgi:hypothetical protein
MKNRALHDKLYIAGAVIALAGVGLVLSVIFAGPGLLLLTLGLVSLLGGLIVDLLAPQFHRFLQALGIPPTRTSAGHER